MNMSQKAIKKRTIETLKSIKVPVQALNNNTEKKTRKPIALPKWTFPLKKFIALPDGLKVKSGNDEGSRARRPVPIKAIGPSGSSSYAKETHVHDGSRPGALDGDIVLSTAIVDSVPLHNGAIQSSHRSRSRARPVATSTPRDRTGQSSETSSRCATPTGSLTGSVTSVDSSGQKRRYTKRSHSTPPDIGRQHIAGSSGTLDFQLNRWTGNENIPGLTRTVSYQTVHNGVITQSDNWTYANKGSGPYLAGPNVQRSTSNYSTHSQDSINTHNTASTDSTSQLEFTDVCSFNPDRTEPRNVSPGISDRARTEEYTGGIDNCGVNTGTTLQAGDSSGIVYKYTPHSDHSGNHEVVRSYSDMNLDKVEMDKYNNNMQYTMQRRGTSQTGVFVYRPGPKGDVVMVNDQPRTVQNGGNFVFHTVGRKEGSLLGSKTKFTSMPTLSSKGDKKILKLLKKQEKMERKQKEKEEKKRAKEEKVRLKLEKKLKTRTLPRNFAYTNGHVMNTPLDKVYRRPKLSLTAVPIDFEDGPGAGPYTPAPQKPPPAPPEPSMRTKSVYASAPDLLRLEQVYGATLRGYPKVLSQQTQSDYSPRTVVLQRSPEGYGFVLRGAKSQLKPNGDLDFRPTPEFPALQYLDSIDPGSASDRAGLKPGDFILTINGENVVRASHDRVVQLIRGTGDTLAMKVVTVRPASRTQDWFAVQDHAMTMPNRKKKAPEPPRRDPTTSLSFSRSEGQAASDELAAFEKLDNAILEKQILEEKKTASIRARLSTKRVSCVDMDKIGVNEAQGPESQIKRNGTQSNGNLERSKSTPDLLDGGRSKSKRDILYATPTVPNKNVYAVPNVNSPSSGSVVAEKVRPKGPPPLPPSEKEMSPRKQAAPKPPATTEPVVVANKTEIITINTQRKSPYMSSTEVRKGIDNKKRESSFRPSTAANLSDEHASSGNNQSEFKPAHVRASSGGAILVKQTAVMSTSEDDGERHNVSFAEDKVLDNAATFLKKHPNAQLLVTAEVHNKKGNRNSQPFEPEPDYDNDEFVVEKRELPAKSRENRQSVTVISVGDEKKPEVTPGSKRYTIHSTIPDVAPQSQSIFIPPRPQGPAPQPPNNRPESPKLKSAAPEPPPLPTSPPPTLPQTPPPDFDTAPFPLEPQQQPAPPPPPPPPPPAPPVTEVTIKQSEVKADFTRTTVPQDAIAAAVAKRQARIQAEGITVTPQKQKPAQTQMDSNQAAILAAVAKRRHMLEQNDETAVIDSIENRLQRTKKLQAAKFQIAGSKVASSKKETDKNPDAKVNGSVPSLTKNKTVEEPKEFSFKVKPTTNPVQISNKGKKEITPKIIVKPSSKVNTVPKPVIVSQTENKQPKTQSLKLKPQPLEKTISNETKNKTETEKNAKNDNGQADFLALAEKKRQEYLLRKSQKSPPDSTTTSPRSSSAGTPEKGKFRSEKLEVKSVNKTNYSPPVSTKPKTKIPVKGTTTDVSYTEFQSSRGLVRVKPLTAMNGDVSQNEKARNITNVPPPPLEFRDLGRKENTVVQLEIIPPPSTFSIDSGTDMSLQHSPAFSPDTASLVSSLSTLSSLSGDQNDIGKGDGYEDMIAPPPPGFDDIEDVTPSVIPPPPEFEGENKTFVLKNGGKSFTMKPVESWLCVDVLDWLDNLNMSQYKASFQKNSVNGQQLLSFSRNNYIDLGVTQVGHRMNLERSIKKAALKQNSVPHDVIASEHL